MKPILIPDFSPVSFNKAFYGSVAIPQDERKILFHHLFFDRYPTRMDSLLRSILCGQAGDDYTFLANTYVERRGSINYRNPRIVSYLIDHLTQNDAEHFYLFLYRVDTIWKNKANTKSKTMRSTLEAFFKHEDDGSSKYEKCLSYLSDSLDEVHDVCEYFSYINLLKTRKPSYAYALMVLWTLLNIQVVYLLPQITKIIIYNDRPTTTYDPRKKYIIKSALNDNLFLSVQKTREPLSAGEGFHNVREMLLSVNYGKFHVPTSIFSFVKCDEYDRQHGEVPCVNNEDNSIINEKEVKKALRWIQKFLREDLPDLANNVLPSKTEPYYIMVDDKFLTYAGNWFSQTRVILKEDREDLSKWRFTKSHSIIGIFNSGHPITIFALDIPNGAQTLSSVIWCFPSIGQAAQRFTIHEVIDWR